MLQARPVIHWSCHPQYHRRNVLVCSCRSGLQVFLAVRHLAPERRCDLEAARDDTLARDQACSAAVGKSYTTHGDFNHHQLQKEIQVQHHLPSFLLMTCNAFFWKTWSLKITHPPPIHMQIKITLTKDGVCQMIGNLVNNTWQGKRDLLVRLDLWLAEQL